MKGETFRGQPCRTCGGLERYRAYSKCVACAKKVGANRNQPKQPRVKKHDPWANRMFRRYGIIPEQYEAIVIEQLGLCAVCFRPMEFGQGKASLDHNHSTGEIRGILCHPCNVLLGHYEKALRMKDALDGYLGRVRVPKAQ